MAVRFHASLRVAGYVVAVVATATAVLVRWLAEPWMSGAAPLITLYGAVAASIGYGGLRPALAATFVGYLACNYVFIEPRGIVAVRTAGDAERLVLYLFTCSIIIGVGEALRLARRRAEASWHYAQSKHHQLEIEVARRTQAEEALREADRRKDEFLAMLSHELRTPLAAAQYAVQLLRTCGSGDESADEAVAVIERQVSQMARLVDDLLDIARIARGKVELRKQRTELAALCDNAVQASRPLIEQKKHELIVQLPPQPVYLEVDPWRVVQVLTNLLNNAAKYTEQGGRLKLTAERRGDEAVVKVRDNGMGIAGDMLPRVFEMFTQVGDPQEHPQGSLGLGLALARQLTEMHGGGIEVKSEGRHQGAEFIVRLPIDPLAGRDGTSAADRPEAHALLCR